MNTNEMTRRKGQQGFTLVELAIVMIIIGLLITGILKGQEMIANAQVTSTISQIKGIDAAASTFRDTYNVLPGDMANATTRLNGCSTTIAACANAATPNGIINGGVGAAPAGEAVQFFLHLLSADLITGLDGSAGAAAFGTQLPTASVGGGFMVGNSTIGLTGFTAGPNVRAGHYLVQNGAAAAVGAATGIMVPSQAARVDRKMDDGLPTSGAVHGATGACQAGPPAGRYAEGDASALCAIMVRIQG